MADITMDHIRKYFSKCLCHFSEEPMMPEEKKMC